MWKGMPADMLGEHTHLMEGTRDSAMRRNIVRIAPGDIPAVIKRALEVYEQKWRNLPDKDRKRLRREFGMIADKVLRSDGEDRAKFLSDLYNL